MELFLEIKKACCVTSHGIEARSGDGNDRSGIELELEKNTPLRPEFPRALAINEG